MYVCIHIYIYMFSRIGPRKTRAGHTRRQETWPHSRNKCFNHSLSLLFNAHPPERTLSRRELSGLRLIEILNPVALYDIYTYDNI